jgi:N4-gp56 family major capsid protein
MADTTAAERVNQWESDFFDEYVRSNRFTPYMGADENAIIQLKDNLTKKKGDAITINLVGALDASGEPNDGSTTLVGAEKALPNDGHKITVKVARDATVVNVEEEQASPIDILKAGKTALKSLATRYLRNGIILALHTINGVKYATATAGQKNTWLAANSDRVLFGSAKANNLANVHADSLATINNTDDKLTGPIVSLARRMAQTAVTANGDGIRPVTYDDGGESYVMFAPTYAFRDLKQWMVDEGKWDTQLERSKENPMYKAGTSIEWDGVMVREIPEMPILADVGADDCDVAPCFLCGAQALGVAWAMRTKATFSKEDDYEFRKGVGFMELRGIEKIQWAQGTSDAIDWSVCTVYVAAEADA